MIKGIRTKYSATMLVDVATYMKKHYGGYFKVGEGYPGIVIVYANPEDWLAFILKHREGLDAYCEACATDIWDNLSWKLSTRKNKLKRLLEGQKKRELLTYSSGASAGKSMPFNNAYIDSVWK